MAHNARHELKEKQDHVLRSAYECQLLFLIIKLLKINNMYKFFFICFSLYLHFFNSANE